MEERQSYLDENWTELLNQLHDASERACATVGAAYCDDLLGRVFAAYFKGNPKCYGELLNPENRAAPLGSFGARITAAYAIGMVKKEERDELRTIAKIRNRFAHDLNPSFENADIAKLCGKLFAPKMEGIIKLTDPTARDLFHTSVYVMMGALAEKLWQIETFKLSGNLQRQFKVSARVGTGQG